jgi:hypothetical protein
MAFPGSPNQMRVPETPPLVPPHRTLGRGSRFGERQALLSGTRLTAARYVAGRGTGGREALQCRESPPRLE